LLLTKAEVAVFPLPPRHDAIALAKFTLERHFGVYGDDGHRPPSFFRGFVSPLQCLNFRTFGPCYLVFSHNCKADLIFRGGAASATGGSSPPHSFFELIHFLARGGTPLHRRFLSPLHTPLGLSPLPPVPPLLRRTTADTLVVLSAGAAPVQIPPGFCPFKGEVRANDPPPSHAWSSTNLPPPRLPGHPPHRGD